MTKKKKPALPDQGAAADQGGAALPDPGDAAEQEAQRQARDQSIAESAEHHRARRQALAAEQEALAVAAAERRRQLEALENRLQRECEQWMQHENAAGRAGFACARTLREIKTSKLYEAAGLGSWTAYVEERVPLGRQWTYKLVRAAAVLERLSLAGDIPADLQSLNQLLELDKLPELQPGLARVQEEHGGVVPSAPLIKAWRQQHFPTRDAGPSLPVLVGAGEQGRLGGSVAPVQEADEREAAPAGSETDVIDAEHRELSPDEGLIPRFQAWLQRSDATEAGYVIWQALRERYLDQLIAELERLQAAR